MARNKKKAGEPDGSAIFSAGGLYQPNTGPRAIYIIKLGSEIIRVGKCGTSNQENYKSPYGRLGTHLSPPAKTASAFFGLKEPGRDRRIKEHLSRRLTTETISFIFWKCKDSETAKCLEKLLSEELKIKNNSTSFCKGSKRNTKDHKLHEAQTGEILKWIAKLQRK